MAPTLDATDACSVGPAQSSYVVPGKFAASVSYRWLHSFREFHGSTELPYPTDPSLYANTRVNGFDVSAMYQASERISVTLSIPFSTGARTTYYEHDFIHRYTMRAAGIGDVRLIGNVWLFDPRTHRSGNISLGLGVKFPTGDYNAKDLSYRATGPVSRPVDPAIQPGDGGWGIVTEISAFQRIYTNTFAYLQGIYLTNPRNTNGTQ